jgi:uncharacterized membrane protein
MTSLSPVGFLHTVACAIALGAGAIVLLGRKGTSQHKLNGRVYVIAMLVTNGSALLIYSQASFRIFHWLALAILPLVIVGGLAARRRTPARSWLTVHIAAMVVSYYLLIGGAINEAYLRIPALHALPPVEKAREIGLMHTVSMLGFAALLAYLLTATRRRHALATGTAAR